MSNGLLWAEKLLIGFSLVIVVSLTLTAFLLW